MGDRYTIRCGLPAGKVSPGSQAIPGPVVAVGCACIAVWSVAPSNVGTRCHVCDGVLVQLTRDDLERRGWLHADVIERLLAHVDTEPLPEKAVA